MCNKLQKSLMLSITIFLWTVFSTAGQNVEEIIRKMDAMQRFDSLYAEGTMILNDRFGEKKSTYLYWTRNTSDFLIEFTNPEERGQKVLRLKNELYLYYPDAEDIIPVRGAALKKSMFGDVSFEDVTEGKNTLEKYKVSLVGSKKVDNVDCWLIEMDAVSRDVPYARQRIAVGKSDYILREAEYYSRSNRLLKIMKTISFKQFENGLVFLTEIKISDQLRKKSSTTMRIEKIQMNPEVDDSLFSLRALR